MVRLTLYSEVNEVGGNRVLVEDEGTKIFLDIGRSIVFGSGFFTRCFQPRILYSLDGYFEFDLWSKRNDFFPKEMHMSTNPAYIELKIARYS